MRIISSPHSYEAIVNHDNADCEVEEDYHPFNRILIYDYHEKTGCAVDISANPNVILFQRHNAIICPIFL